MNKLNKNRIVNLKNRKRIFKNSLTIEIQKTPERFNKEEIIKFKKNYERVDDLYYIEENSNLLHSLYLGGGLILLSIFLIVILKIDSPSTILFYSIPAIIGLFNILFDLLKKNRRKIVLDRFNNLLSYPDYLLKKPIITRFDNTFAIIGGKGSYGALILKLRQTSFLTNYHLNNYAPYKFWSFMVWYMDKNRPLPPGTAFDPYRQKDFERRKAEGFPPPLYYSNGIITPEATPEQQAERERYWKDREYFAPPIKRPENSEIFNTNTHQNWSKCNFENGEHKLTNTWYEFTFNDGKIVYMLTNENGVGYLPPENLNYKTASLTIKDGWF